jgi:hypothetical protein
MSLLSVVKDVCEVVGVTLPTSVFSNITGNRTMQEMLTLANEMAQRIAYDTREWNILKSTKRFLGDGTTEAFDMPSDYQRMLLTSNVWRSTTPSVQMRFIPDLDEWVNRRARGYYDNRGEWIIYGGQMHIVPVLGVGASAYFPYLTKNCVTLAAGGTGNEFKTDNDSFILGDRIHKLGMIWQWKAQKGSPYAEDMGSYEDALASVAGRDSPAPILLGRRPSSVAITAAYPTMLPGPWP